MGSNLSNIFGKNKNNNNHQQKYTEGTQAAREAKIQERNRLDLGNECNICGKIFVHRTLLKKHRRSHKKKKKQCQYCDKEYSKAFSLKRHISHEHTEIFSTLTTTDGHGRLMEPPSRNAMWRFGYPNPVNYNDNELFCGGYAVQWEQNEGKCGVCGDAFNSNRVHEAGGEYAKGILTRHYTAGQEIDIEVELTANHYGRFELYLCPNNNAYNEATQGCFDRYPLHISGIPNENRFFIPPEAEKKGTFKYRVKLPDYITCTQCVIQWTYFTGNMWGTCDNGTEAVGCGKPETFRNCADVTIKSNTAGGLPPIFIQNPFLLYYRDGRLPEPNNVYPLVIKDQVCVPTKQFEQFQGMGFWCQVNCLRYPPNCPETVCYCPRDCKAIGEIQGKEGADVYCLDKCINYPSDCPANRCRCF